MSFGCDTPFDMSLMGHVDVSPPLTVYQKQAASVTYGVKNQAGMPYQFEDGDAVTVTAREAFWSQDILFETTATVTNAAEGIISLSVPALSFAGAAYAEVTVERGGQVVYIQPFHLISQRTLKERGMGQLTLMEIRIFLRDVTAQSNFTLDEVEFTDVEIMRAMEMPIEYWNETPPSVGTYKLSNFPFRYHLTFGTVAHLFRIAAHHYIREETTIRVTGGTIDHKNKAAQYLALAQDYDGRWQAFVRRKKAELNMRQGFKYVKSPYRHLF